MRVKQSRFLPNADIPLLSYVQAINTMDTEEKENLSKVGLDEELAKIASSHSFALMINDTSMASTFMPDDIIIIDPGVVPHQGEFVVAKLKENNTDILVFRKYRPLFHNGAEGFELIALSKN